jgi:hypothetical protein
MGPEWIVVLLVVGFGIASGLIWQSKGGNFAIGFLLGFFLGLIGLIIVLVVRPSGARSPDAPALNPDRSAITWTHTGAHYLMGYTLSPAAYGIWDRGASGSPILRYPYTEPGKAEAEAKFWELEPTGAAVTSPSVPVLPPPPT